MYFLGPNKTSSKEDTADIILDQENNKYTFTNKFKYIGTYFQPDLIDDFELEKRIKSAIRAFRIMEKV